MTRITTRSSDGDPAQNFSEVTTGEAPCSVEVSVNAKGIAQWSLKLYFASPDELLTHARAQLDEAISVVEAALIEHDIAIATDFAPDPPEQAITSREVRAQQRRVVDWERAVAWEELDTPPSATPTPMQTAARSHSTGRWGGQC